MLDLGWTEILVVGVVALIVIGPRELPVALHTFGKYIAKLKAMAREFQSGIDDIARQHELKELQEGINKFKLPEQAIENYVSGLEKTGAKPADSDAAPVEPEAENSIADAITDEKDGDIKDWGAASAAAASPAAMSVASAAPEEEPELPLGVDDSQTAKNDAVSSDPAAGGGTKAAAADTLEPKPGQTAAT